MKSTILVIKTHALGDVLLTTPSVHRLRRAFPHARILYLTTKQCAPLIRSNPDIDSIITIPDLRPGIAILKCLHRIRRQNPELAVVFQCSRIARAAARIACGGRIVHMDRNHRPGDTSSCPWPPPWDRYTGDAYQCLVDLVTSSAPSIPPQPRLFPSEIEKEEGMVLLRRNGLKRDTYLVIAPGGGMNIREHVPAKLWPSERFSSLASRLESMYHLPVVLVGAETDTLITRRIASEADTGLIDLGGKTSLTDLSSLIRLARCVITNDSLPLHLSVAFSTPVIGLFGPTSSSNFIPSGSLTAIGISSSAQCSPCYGNEIFPGCPLDDPICMSMITVDEVVSTVERIMNSDQKTVTDDAKK